MTEITDGRQFRIGTFAAPGVRTIIVHDGRRGDPGAKGDKGDQGDQGPGFNMRGPWQSGTTYSPLDAVTAPSSLDAMVTSLYIQNSGIPSSGSVTQPKDDPARWGEVGQTEFGDAFGNVWEVTQVGHGFTMIGQPVAWDATSDLYVPASVQNAGELPVAVVREIVDNDNLKLQSSGLIRAPDPQVNFDGPAWTDGAIYYQRLNGVLTSQKPPSGFVVPVLRIVEDGDAIVFPPLLEEMTQPDPAPAPATTHLKVDDISGLFDNTSLQFPLEVSAAPIAWPASTESFRIYIDGNPQEPLIDFVVVDNLGAAEIQFTEAPEDFQWFWGVYATA